MGKKAPLILAALTITMVQVAPAYASGGVTAPCDNSQIQANLQAIRDAAQANYNNGAPAPGNLDGCLSSLSALNISIGTFNLSSIFNSLMNQACQMANSEIQNVTNGAISQINSTVGSVAPGANSVVSVGSGSGTVTVNNGGANNLIQPTINNATTSSLSSVFGN